MVSKANLVSQRSLLRHAPSGVITQSNLAWFLVSNFCHRNAWEQICSEQQSSSNQLSRLNDYSNRLQTTGNDPPQELFTNRRLCRTDCNSAHVTVQGSSSGVRRSSLDLWKALSLNLKGLLSPLSIAHYGQHVHIGIRTDNLPFGLGIALLRIFGSCFSRVKSCQWCMSLCWIHFIRVVRSLNG